MLEFHICPQKGCCVFVADYANNIFCNGCNAQRFRKCAHVGCRGKNYDECTHKFENKISNKSLFYRPITNLISKLLELPAFITALNYSFLNKTSSYKYMDCSHGSTYKKNMDEMIQKYNDLFADKIKNKPIMINLLLGQFYDGCQLYKKKCIVFWPLNLIILNLPPSYRVRLGIGMFLLSIFTSMQHSNVEDFLLRSLVVGELQKLNEGIHMNVQGVNYFIQARMILTILDTIAVQEFLHVQTNQSLSGCFVCHNGKGYNYLLDRQVYIGIREMSDLRHYCRKFGQSGKCCPPNYYVHGKQDECFEVIEYENANDIAIYDIIPPIRIAGLFDVCDKNNSENISRWLRNPSNNWVWYHTEHDYRIFKDDLHYHHSDYRPKVAYERKTNKQYLKLGELARENCKNNPKLEKHSKHVNGVKGTWAMAELDYVDIETDVCWGGMHALMNVATNMIENWKGERITKSSTHMIEYCRLTGTHPDLYRLFEVYVDKKKTKTKTVSVDYYKWEISNDVQDKVIPNKILKP
jgi:hypothetical protein